MNGKQVISGKAFEYGIAYQCSKSLNAKLNNNKNFTNAKKSFELCDEKEQEKIMLSSSKAILFLIEHDKNISPNYTSDIEIQPDTIGKYGDVRDIVIHNRELNIDTGISVKNRHCAIKHSRLSEKIDFGKDWFGESNTNYYWNQITNSFKELNDRRKK